MGLDTSHFAGQAYLRGKTHSWSKKVPLNQILVEKSTYSRSSLKRRLIDEGILKNKCYECGLQDQWNGKPIKIQLDHINGINNDNRLENLRMICPNCHSQTPTYCGRAKKTQNIFGNISGRKASCRTCNGEFCVTASRKYFCSVACSCKWRNEKRKAEIASSIRCKCCDKLFLPQNGYRFCSQVCWKMFSRKVPRPSKEELSAKIAAGTPWVQLGRDYGATDNAVRKWARTYGIMAV